jgi:HK97 family phage major capsid protein
MAKLNELKTEELTAGLTAEQKKAIYADYIKTNKEDADKIIASDAPSTLKKELTEFIEERNSEIQEQMKSVGETVKAIEKSLAERKYSTDDTKTNIMSLGQYIQVLAKKELVRHEAGIKITEEEINKFNEVNKSIKTAGAGMEEGDFSLGGSFLRPDYSSELLKNGYESAGLINLARQMTTSGNSLKFAAIDDYDKSSGYVSGAVIMYWMNEKDSVTVSKPTTSEYTIQLDKLGGLSYASNELIEDSPFSIEQQLKGDFADAFALAMDDVMINGMGTKEPQGILNAPSLITVPIESGQTLAVDPINPINIMKMWAGMKRASQRRAVWVMNPDLLAWLPQMNLTLGMNGIPVFLPMNSLANQPYMTLYGRPIIVNECCQALGTLGDIFFADWNGYVILTKSNGGLRYETSIHVEFLYDQMTFRFIYRIGGRSIQKTYQTPRRGTTYTSNFVTLAART